MRSIEDLVVFVTGGGRGIGRATCLECAEAGATVYTCARSSQELSETVDQFEGDGRGAMIAHTADVTRPSEVERVIDRIRETEGRLDALVNNAGVLGPREPIEEVELDAWRETMEVNLDGVFLVTRAAIPLLGRAEQGIVVNISSSVGREGRGRWGPYAVSKHGVEGLTGTLADELAEDETTVVSANPGGTATEMRAAAYPDEDPETLPTPGEVAETLRLLVEVAELDQTGETYDCRDLFDLVSGEERPDPADLPPAGG